jgi:hypothetical protein
VDTDLMPDFGFQVNPLGRRFLRPCHLLWAVTFVGTGTVHQETACIYSCEGWVQLWMMTLSSRLKVMTHYLLSCCRLQYAYLQPRLLLVGPFPRVFFEFDESFLATCLFTHNNSSHRRQHSLLTFKTAAVDLIPLRKIVIQSFQEFSTA